LFSPALAGFDIRVQDFVGNLFGSPVKPGVRNIVVSSQKDRASGWVQSGREGTFYLREISEKVQKSLKRACSRF